MAYVDDYPKVQHAAPKVIEHAFEGLSRDYFAAKMEFDEACQSFAAASERRNRAEEQLRLMTESVAQALANGLQDPTAPSCPTPTTPNLQGQTLGPIGRSRY